MKQIHIMLTALLVFCMMSLNVYAGDVPEELLAHDQAEVFFGEVVGYEKTDEEQSIKLRAVKTIKGDVESGTVKSYSESITVGFEGIKSGKIYLIAYFDEFNPTYVFETTTTDTKSLKLIDASGNMWERLEKYLNDGEFEKAEAERRERINAQKLFPEEITLAEYMKADRENAEKVYFIVGGEYVKINKKAFFDVAESTVLTKAENVTDADHEGIYIEIENKDSTRSYAYISQHGEADLCSPMMGRLPACDYTVTMAEVADLNALMNRQVGYYVIITGVVILAVAAAILITRRKKK